MKRLLLGLMCVMVMVVAFCTIGCETVKGTGKDVEHLGESMQGD